MRSKQKATIILMVLGIVFTLSAISNYNISSDQVNNDGSVEIRDETNLKSPKKSATFSESFIHIDGSIPDNWSLTESTYGWCSGSGIGGDPYIIENVTIDAGGTGDGILINNSKNVYFIIRNCNVTNAGSTGISFFPPYPGDGGIKLENTNNGTLTNNNCSNNGYAGILLYSNCKNNTILENMNEYNQRGIFLYTDCENNTISGNTANKNAGVGIMLEDCDNNTIIGNHASYLNQFGIVIGGDDNKILNNTANNNIFWGIYIDISRSIVSRNIANNNGDYGIWVGGDSDNNNITENYLYFNTNGAILIYEDCDDNRIERNVMVSSDEKFIIDNGTNTILSGNYYLTTPPGLFVEVIAQSFSTSEFVVAFNISSQCIGLEVSVLSIQMWWNGEDVSNDLNDLGYGLYNVTLTPEFVEPGGNLILLNMTISAAHHTDKYFELKLAVDPKAVTPPPPPSDDDDDDDEKPTEPDTLVLLLIIVGIASAIGIAGIAIFLIKKRAKLRE